MSNLKRTGWPCGWPGCTKLVPRSRWGCRAHWSRLPLRLRQRIHRTYDPDSRPSEAYKAANREALEWIREHGAERRPVVAQDDRPRHLNILPGEPPDLSAAEVLRRMRERDKKLGIIIDPVTGFRRNPT